MAQLFTLYFPKYYFDLQKEFDVEFKADLDLPFDYIIEDGCCYVSEVFYDKHNQGGMYYVETCDITQNPQITKFQNEFQIEFHND